MLYAGLNVRWPADLRVEGDGEIVAHRIVEGELIPPAARGPSGPERVPSWDEIEVQMGAAVVILPFQLVARPPETRPTFPLAPGDRVRLDARLDRRWHEVTILDPQGMPLLVTAHAPPEGFSTPTLSAVAGPVLEHVMFVTSSSVLVRLKGGPPVEIASDRWHHVTLGGRRFAVAAEHLLPQPPSAMISQLNLAMIAERPLALRAL